MVSPTLGKEAALERHMFRWTVVTFLQRLEPTPKTQSGVGLNACLRIETSLAKQYFSLPPRGMANQSALTSSCYKVAQLRERFGFFFVLGGFLPGEGPRPSDQEGVCRDFGGEGGYFFFFGAETPTKTRTT